MKQLLSIILLLFAAHSLRAVDYTCHTQAGQLQSLIGVPGSTITRLTVSGTLDARDFAYIGDSLTQLTSIDLTDCTIAAFESRDTYLANQSRFEANSLPAHTFIGFQNLTTVQTTPPDPSHRRSGLCRVPGTDHRSVGRPIANHRRSGLLGLHGAQYSTPGYPPNHRRIRFRPMCLHPARPVGHSLTHNRSQQ